MNSKKTNFYIGVDVNTIKSVENKSIKTTIF